MNMVILMYIFTALAVLGTFQPTKALEATDEDPEFTKLFDDLDTYIGNLKLDKEKMDGIQSYVEKTRKDTKALKSLADYGTLRGAAAATAASIPKFASGDPLQIGQGVMDTINAFTGFIPDPAGAALGSLLSITSALIGLGSNQPSITEILDKMLDEKLNQLYMRIESKIDADVGREVMGDIEVIVKGLIQQMRGSGRDQHKNEFLKVSDSQDIYDLLQAYAQLVSWRRTILTMARSVYYSTDFTKVSEYAIKMAIEKMPEHDRWLEFLRKPKTGKEVVFAASYRSNPRDQTLDLFLQQSGHHPHLTNHQLLEKRCFRVNTDSEGTMPANFYLYSPVDEQDRKMVYIGNRNVGAHVMDKLDGAPAEVEVAKSTSTPGLLLLRYRHGYAKQGMEMQDAQSHTMQRNLNDKTFRYAGVSDGVPGDSADFTVIQMPGDGYILVMYDGENIFHLSDYEPHAKVFKEPVDKSSTTSDNYKDLSTNLQARFFIGECLNQ